MKAPEIAERRALVAEMATAGFRDTEIAETIGVSAQTVLRDRKLLGLLPVWVWRHGTHSGYRHGCRCDECRRANAASHRAYMHRAGRVEAQYVPCPRCGKRVRVVDGVTVASRGEHRCGGAA